MARELVSDSGLTAEQLNAAAMVATGLSKDKVAKSLGIRKQTVVDWTNDPKFQAEVELRMNQSADMLIELANEGRIGLLGLLQDVNETLRQSLEATTPKGSPDWWARHKGAELILKAAGMMSNGGAFGKAMDQQTGPTTNVSVVVVNTDDVQRANEIVTKVESVIDVEAIEKEQEFQHSLPIEQAGNEDAE
jgi:DNA-binding XRE family transcriptional regulator